MEITRDSVCVVHNCANMRKLRVDGKYKYYCDTMNNCCDEDKPVPTGHVFKISECNNVQRR